MKKGIFATLLAGIVLAGATSIATESKSSKLSQMGLENVEALTRSEIGDACGGCSTKYPGRKCCTIIMMGEPFVLYYPS